MKLAILIISILASALSDPYRHKLKQKKPVYCGCIPVHDPLCGSDGKTYKNRCEFNCGGAKPGKYVVHKGPCNPPDTESYTPKPILCGCKPVNEQLCGSDGKTYKSRCEFNCGGKKPGKYVVHKGPCNPPDTESYTPKPILCGCKPVNEPLCGSDGKTYKNRCEFNCGGAKPGKYVVHKGPCNPPDTESYTPKQLCGCKPVNEQLCGSDGKTYKNRCEFNCGGKNPGKYVVHKGPCNPPDTESYTPKPILCGCKPVNEPLCGSDGKTYKNRCEFNCGGKKPGKYVVHKGPCNPPDTESYTPKPILCGCKPVNEPLCGSDGKTYKNRCEFNCGGKKPGKYVIHKGPCNPKATNKTIICACKPVNNPLCGSDGKTYKNRCEFGCSRDNPGKYVVHKGPCNTPAIQKLILCGCKPVNEQLCASDGKTYKNRCEFNCGGAKSGKYVVHKGPCNPPDTKSYTPKQLCGCKPVNDPLCGSDGKTYKNRCEFNCGGAKPGKYVVHKGPCKLSDTESAHTTLLRIPNPYESYNYNPYPNY